MSLVNNAIDIAAESCGLSREQYLGAVAGQLIALAIYRVLGAPWWAAWGLSLIQANQIVINKRQVS